MFRNILFAIVLVILGVSFYYSRDFQLIAAGIAVLLFGMSFLERGFESAASGTLYKLVKKLSNNFFLSFLLGILATTILQSSSLITVIAISFLSTGLLSLRSGLGIVFGANLGTTSTAWIVAFLGVKLSISALALPLIFFGIVLQSRKVALQKSIGNIMLGLGGFFMGVYLMQLGFADMEGAAFLQTSSQNPFLISAISLLSGLAVTAILQSSGATMAIIITALVAGKIDFSQSLAMAIGANIGTTVTAILSSLNAKLPGKQLAVGHLVFNVLTGIVALLLLPVFVYLIQKGVDVLELDQNDQSLRLALFHTLFNVLGVVLILPFTKPLERLLKRIPFKKQTEASPLYLTQFDKTIPQAAYLALHKETAHVLELLATHIYNAVDKQFSQHNERLITMLTTSDTKPFKALYYDQIKPILAQIQYTAAELSGTYKTQQFSVISRLVAEISRDFDHILKVKKDNDLMQQEAFRAIYTDLMRHLQLASEILLHIQKEKNGALVENQIEKRKNAFDLFNTELVTRVNQSIVKKQLSPLAGTTAIHTADYTKHVVHKLSRSTHLLYKVDYLESEAEIAFETDVS
jgi:phosphate:Na+ symporter